MRRFLAALATVVVLAPVAACGGGGGGETPEGAWDVVVFGDSHASGVAEPYAEHVAVANDVEVVLHNECEGGMQAIAVASRLGIDDAWRDLVRDAEVVVYYGNPVGAEAEGTEVNCGHDSQTGIRRSQCEPDAYDGYQEALEQIVIHIKELRDGQPTIIRALEDYSPSIALYRGDVYEECRACDRYVRDATRAAADSQGVLIAKVWDEFNGPDITEDPIAKGYIGGDGTHPSGKGFQVMADLLDELGYEPTP